MNSPTRFPAGLDYTLSSIGLVRPSFATRYHLVSEPSPWPTITALGAWLRIPDFGAACTSSTAFFPYPQSFSGASCRFRGCNLGSNGFTDFPNNLEALLSLGYVKWYLKRVYCIRTSGILWHGLPVHLCSRSFQQTEQPDYLLSLGPDSCES